MNSVDPSYEKIKESKLCATYFCNYCEEETWHYFFGENEDPDYYYLREKICSECVHKN